MNQTTLADIFARLPKADQVAALIHSLEMIFARSEWPLINDLLPEILRMQGQEKLRTHALSIGVKAALRLREYDLAFEHYQQLQESGKSHTDTLLQIEALYQMVIQILPAKADKLSAIWESFISPDMPIEALEVWAKIGILLWQAFSKTRQEGRASYIKVRLQDHLPESLWNRNRYKLEKE